MSELKLLTLDDIDRALGFIHDYDNRETWVQMAMAIKSEFGPAGFDAWDQWSAQSDSYKSADAKAVWKSIRESGRTGIGTLIKLAKDNGFKFSVKEIDQAERDRRTQAAIERKKVNKIRREQAEKEHKENQQNAAARAVDIWGKLPVEGPSEYLARKQIHGFGCRYSRGSIVVPVTKNGALTGLQFIAPDGGKKFLTGTEKQGGYFFIAGAEADNPLVLCEGYATGCSIRTATGFDVLVCFDAGNIASVLDELKTRAAEKLVFIAADNDHLKPVNTGLQVAQQLLQKYPDVRVVWPEFSEADTGTDFNDLHLAKGLDAVKAVFMQSKAQALPAGCSQPVQAPDAPLSLDEVEQQGAKKRRESSPTLSGEGGFSFSVESMLENFAHVYGKSPSIFDKKRRKLISPSTLHEIAEDAYKAWKKSPERHIVDESCVVFDPSMGSDPETTVNLFGGFPLKPADGECSKIIDLLFYLVNENTEVFDWLLKWIALPLQHPGAKMRTAVVMHGTEGAGKNLFFSVLEQIYGEYATIITQNELESQFNGWASKKLFVIGNEVVSRQEMYHKKGIIKNMITEPEWLINDKNMPLRREANHANFVFFSNVMQPVTPDTGDRRFMIIWTPKKQAPDYYRAVVDEINQGGVEAFYQYLMRLKLDDFSEFSEPIMTQAKDDLIDLSMRSDERFIKRWKASDLPVPFCLCRTMDLYAAYQHWSRVEGEKFSVSKTEFLMRLNHDEATEKHTGLRYILGSASSKRTSFIGPVGQLGSVPSGVSKEQFVGNHAQAVIEALSAWRGNDYDPEQ